MRFTKRQKEISEHWIKEYAHKVSEDFPNVFNSFVEKPFTAVETGVHPKVIADWNRKDILLNGPKPKKHHRFSLSEFVWIKMVEKLREYNFSLGLIRSFRNEMLIPLGIDLTDLLETPDFMDLMFNMIPKEHHAKAKAKLKDPAIREEMFQLFGGLSKFNNLDNIILVALFSQKPVSFLIDKDGQGMMFSSMFLDFKEHAETFMEVLGHTHMNLSLSEIVAQALCLAPIEKVSEQLQLVTSDEAAVLEALRENNVQQVTVRLDKKGELDLMEVTKELNVDKRSRLMEMMLMNGYQDITLKTAKGKIVYCENKRKVKLK